MSRKILISGASQGFGHLRAAANLAKALERSKYGSAKVIDILDYLPIPARFIFKDCWRFLSVQWPRIYHAIYRGFLSSRSRHGLLLYLANRAVDQIIKENGIPEVFITTHSLGIPLGEILKNRYKSKFFVVATDFVFHSAHVTSDADRIYLPPGCDLLLNSIESQTVQKLLQYTGIPIDPSFMLHKDVPSLKKEFSMDADLKTVLISFGGGALKANQNIKLIRELTSSSLPLQYIVLTGHDSQFAAAMYELGRSNERVKIIPFRENVSDFYAVSDLFVGKAGGLSISEAISMRLPMFIVDKMPGQEDFNLNLICKLKLGKYSRSSGELISQIRSYLAIRNSRFVQKNFDRLARPQSSRSIVRSIVKSTSIHPN